MPVLDTEAILNGTFHKQLFHAYESMKSTGLTRESANNYKSLYENRPVSDILNESELIFKEPIKGLRFYENVLINNKVPLHRYTDEKRKFEEFVNENKDKMSDTQREMYESALTNINTHLDSIRNEINLSFTSTSDEAKSMIESMCDEYNSHDRGMIINAVDSFFESEIIDPVNKILYGYYILPTYNSGKLYNMMKKEMSVTESMDTDPTEYSSIVLSNVIGTYLSEDSNIQKEINGSRNINLKLLVKESSNENYKNALDEIFIERVSNYEPEYSSLEECIMHMASDDMFTESVSDDMDAIKKADAIKANYVIEAVSSIIYAEYLANDYDVNVSSKSMLEMADRDSMNIREAMDYLSEKTAEYESIIESDNTHFFEYTRAGEQTPTIKGTASNAREEIFSNKRSKAKKNTSVRNDDEDDNVDEEENTSTGKREPSMEKPGKETITKKIQHKATDIDAAMQKKVSKMDAAKTDLKNAGKAITRIPGNIVKGIKNTINNWNTMDEEKRKKKILEPGYRNEIFKGLKTVLVYGSLAQIHLWMAPAFFIFKHTLASPIIKLDKARGARLRNELTAEIETELKIIDEKIADASKDDKDQKQKYELMRIKGKLEAERVRVMTNSKYI